MELKAMTEPLTALDRQDSDESRRLAAEHMRALILLRKCLGMLRGGNCCDGEDATMTDESRAFQVEIATYLETYEEPEHGDPDWRNG